jgi:antitoxin CptB
VDAAARNRLTWRCRRGRLELDLVLSRIVPLLKDEDLPLFTELLGLPDDDLWDILAGRSDHQDARFKPLVARLRAA